MNKYYLLCGLLIILLLNPIVVQADQPYEGARFTHSKDTTDHVIFECSFPSTNGEKFDNGNWVGGVISVAGRDGSSPSGYWYQCGFAVNDDDEVIFAPMYLYGTVVQEQMDPQEVVGDSNYNYFFGRIDFDEDNDEIVYRCFAYDTDSDVERDICDVEEWTSDIEAGEDSFYYGYQNRSIGGVNWPFGFLQVGAESNENVTETFWKVHLGQFGYYDDSDWEYSSGKSMIGNRSYITWVGSTPIKIGGLNMNADKDTSDTDTVTWERGTMFEHNESLWTGSDTLIPIVDTPFDM